MDYCLHLYAPLVLTRTSISQRLKKSVSTNGIRSALTALESMFFFPSGMFHRGYYNDKPNTIFIKAQLFCAPTEYTNVLRFPWSIMKGEGNDIIRGHLDESTLLELRDDLINNWDIHYSNPNYRPWKNLSGGPVDRTSNRQIYKKHFTQVLLLKKLVDSFETMFPYLSVDLVWLLRKSK